MLRRTVSRPSLSWKAHLGLSTRFLLLSDSCGFVDMGRSLWREDGSDVTIAAGPRQPNHSRVRVPWDSRPYFTVSDLRLPILSPPTTRRATVEVFDPASTRANVEAGSNTSPVSDLSESSPQAISFADWIGNTLSKGWVYPLSRKHLRCAGNVSTLTMKTLLSVA
jgi:hypothetical protein